MPRKKPSGSKSDERASIPLIKSSALMTSKPSVTSPTPTPGSERPPTTGATALVRRKVTKIWKSLAGFEQAVGGRQALIDAVSEGKLDAKGLSLVKMLADPARAGDSLATICADVGVPANEILTLFRDAAMARALTAAQLQMSEHLPAIVDDVAEKAQDHTERCGCTYGATGPVPPLVGCPNCHGGGVRHFRSSLPHQELVLESMNLLKKGSPGVNVRVQQGVAIGAGGAFFDSLVRATDGPALKEPPTVIEASLVEREREDT